MNIKLIKSISIMFVVIVLAFGFVTSVNAQSVNILAGRDMSTGSAGRDVVVLQGMLSEMGYLTVPAGISLGYFGPLTTAAVARYQASQSVGPSTGYFGSLTKIALRAHLTSRGWTTMLGWW